MLEKFNEDDFTNIDTFRILNTNVEQKGVYTFEYIKKIIEESKLDGIILNKNCKPIIVKLGDFQKILYEEKKKQKELEKKRKLSIKDIKEVKFHLGIAQNDYNYKVQHIQDFLNNNCKVKVEVFLRGREITMKDAALDLLNNIIENFNSDEYLKTKVNNINNIVNIIIEKK